jgi:hypothetical protein
MNSIHFILEKITTDDMNVVRRWEDVVDDIFGKSKPTYNNKVCAEGVLVLRDGNDLPSLARAIFAAEEGRFAYKLVFNGDDGEWKRTP